MEEISAYGIILLFLIIGIVFVLFVFLVTSFIKPHRPNPSKLAPYECGEESIGTPWNNFNLRFYIIGLIFILFEAEIIFIFPWATIFGHRQLNELSNNSWGYYNIVEMFIFIAILTLGLVWAWAKGYLDWNKSNPTPETFKSKVPNELYNKINDKYQ